MRTSLLILFFLFLFGSLQAQVVKDTVKHGTIRVRKVQTKDTLAISKIGIGNRVNPGSFEDRVYDTVVQVKNPSPPLIVKKFRTHVEVDNEYAVYLKSGDAPKLGKIKGSRLKYIKSDDLRSAGQNEENPVPLGSSASGRDSGSKENGISDTIYDIAAYMADTIHFTFSEKDAGRPDTIQLRIIIDRKGNYKYTFASRQDSLSRAGQKCMEALTTIRKWQPARVYSSAQPGSRTRKPRKKSAYSEILMTIVLRAEAYSEEEESKK